MLLILYIVDIVFSSISMENDYMLIRQTSFSIIYNSDSGRIKLITC